MFDKFYAQNTETVCYGTGQSEPGKTDSRVEIYDDSPQPPKARSKHNAARAAAFGLCCAILGGAVGGIVNKNNSM